MINRKSVVICSLLACIVGIIAIIATVCQLFWLFIASYLCLLAALIIRLRLYRCPHCGARGNKFGVYGGVMRDFSGYCNTCGKEVHIWW